MLASRTCSFIISCALIREDLFMSFCSNVGVRTEATGWKRDFVKNRITVQLCNYELQENIISFPLAEVCLSDVQPHYPSTQLSHYPTIYVTAQITHFAFGRSARERGISSKPSKEGQTQDRRGLCAAKGRLTLRRKEGSSRAPGRTDGERERRTEGRAEGQTAFSDDCGSCPDDDKGKNHPRISVPGELDSISRRRISSEQAYPEQVLSRCGASARYPPERGGAGAVSLNDSA